MNSIQDRTLVILREVFLVKEGVLSLQTPFIDLAQDSMDIIELLSVLTSEFGIVLYPGELDSIVTVGDLIGYIEKHAQKS